MTELELKIKKDKVINSIKKLKPSIIILKFKTLRINKLVFKIIGVLLLAIFIIVIGGKFISKKIQKEKALQSQFEKGTIKLETLKPSVYKLQEINDSLLIIKPLDDKMFKAVKAKQKDTSDFNEKLIGIKEYRNGLTEGSKNLTAALNELKKVKCPNEVSDLKELIINQYTIFNEGMKIELEYLTNKNNEKLNEAKSYYDKFLKLYEKSKIESKKIIKKYSIN